jgi:hypothetical protein
MSCVLQIPIICICSLIFRSESFLDGLATRRLTIGAPVQALA